MTTMPKLNPFSIIARGLFAVPVIIVSGAFGTYVASEFIRLAPGPGEQAYSVFAGFVCFAIMLVALYAVGKMAKIL